MKRFQSLSTDRDGRKYGGAFEAPDIEAARRMLEEQGYVVLTLEEIPEVAAEKEDLQALKKAAFEKKAAPSSPERAAGRALVGPSKRRGTGLLKPFLFALGALVILPLSVYWLTPRKPAVPPEDVLTAFFDGEFARAYEKQYSLFSGKHKAGYGSPESYVRRRQGEEVKEARRLAGEQKEEKPVIPLAAGLPGVLQELKRLESSAVDASYEAVVRKPENVDRYLFKLAAEEGEWKISSLEIVRGEIQKTPKRESFKQEPEELSDPKEIKARALEMIEKARAKGVIDETEYRRKIRELNSISSSESKSV